MTKSYRLFFINSNLINEKIILLFAFSFIKLLYAQYPIKRVLVDSSTKKTISYTTIKILGSKIGTYSDGSGIFTILINPKDTILITSIGYYPQRLTGKESGHERYSAFTKRSSAIIKRKMI